jgi:hypothetical protein
MLFGDDEGVSRREGVDIEKGNEVLIFINYVGWNFFIYYFTEDAGHKILLYYMLNNFMAEG